MWDCFRLGVEALRAFGFGTDTFCGVVLTSCLMSWAEDEMVEMMLAVVVGAMAVGAATVLMESTAFVSGALFGNIRNLSGLRSVSGAGATMAGTGSGWGSFVYAPRTSGS
uniref:(northern house mosquito) hypothetical protein n=1 Tax=Culex pipiens TaxID=7175 RepID=A0A8D8J644_CULPI